MNTKICTDIEQSKKLIELGIETDNMWNKQSEKDICDSINDWNFHKYECFMKDKTMQKFSGLQDEAPSGSIYVHINCVNDNYDIDDIVLWREI